MATGTLAAATALTACSGGGSTGKASTAASSAPASSAAASEAADPSKYEVTEPITITWWHSLETQYDELVTDIVDRFNKSQDLITVEAQYIGTYSEANEAMAAANAAGTGLPALTVSSTKYITAYGESGALENLDPYVAASGYDINDFSAGLLLAGQYQGSQMALPFLHSTQVIYYNKTMADANGWTIPETIEEFTPFLSEVHSKAGVYGT
ncbi:MAG: extracellular solute-binding protein, partial [Ruminococcaceae bacterium]|nr:extracellular solute-binding protein [Oscillospiraceae bacterium]